MKPKSGRTSKPKRAISKVQKPAVSAATIKKTLKKVIEKDLLIEQAGNVRAGRHRKDLPVVNEKTQSTGRGTKNRLHNDHEASGGSQDQPNVTKRQKTSLEIPKRPTQEGSIFVVGENDVGQLGLENVGTKKRPVELPLGVPIVEIAAGGMHSVCLSASGEVYTFGCNDEGALGRPQTSDDSEVLPAVVDLPEKVVMISVGDSHTAALSVTGRVYLWGNFRSNRGAIGLTGDGRKRTTPLRILENVEIVKIASGAEHLVCLSSEGDVYTCGCAESGQLGRVAQRGAEDGGRKGIARLLTPDIVRVAGKKRKFDNIWTGSYVTFLHEINSKNIYAFGLNNYHQLGYDNKNFEITRYQPKCITSFPSDTKIISGGGHHTLVLDKLGHVFSVGRNDYGRLGLGSRDSEVSQLTLIPSLQNENCCNIACGNCVSFAVNTNGVAYSWGMGDNCQLGHGSDVDCLVPTAIEGNLTSWHVIKVSSGGQHTLLLARRKDT